MFEPEAELKEPDPIDGRLPVYSVFALPALSK